MKFVDVDVVVVNDAFVASVNDDGIAADDDDDDTDADVAEHWSSPTSPLAELNSGNTRDQTPFKN